MELNKIVEFIGYDNKYNLACNIIKNEEMKIEDKIKSMREIATNVGAKLPFRLEYNDQKELLHHFNNIHTALQTKTMLKACVWAAVAAIVACISVILTMCLN